MKLIKITEDHYVVVDDLEIKEHDYYLFTWGGGQDIQRFSKEQYADRENHKHLYANAYKKITHSTQPLEKERITNPTTQIIRDAMKMVEVRKPKVVRDK